MVESKLGGKSCQRSYSCCVCAPGFVRWSGLASTEYWKRGMLLRHLENSRKPWNERKQTKETRWNPKEMDGARCLTSRMLNSLDGGENERRLCFGKDALGTRGASFRGNSGGKGAGSERSIQGMWISSLKKRKKGALVGRILGKRKKDTRGSKNGFDFQETGANSKGLGSMVETGCFTSVTCFAQGPTLR